MLMLILFRKVDWFILIIHNVCVISVFVRDDIIISSRWPYVVFTDDCLALIEDY